MKYYVKDDAMIVDIVSDLPIWISDIIEWGIWLDENTGRKYLYIAYYLETNSMKNHISSI
jgi:hypothetical protein